MILDRIQNFGLTEWSIFLTCAVAFLSALWVFLRRYVYRLKTAPHEDHARTLVQSAPDVMIILEPDSTVRYVSPAVRRVLGYSPEDLAGKDFSQYLHYDESSEQMPRALISEIPTAALTPDTELFLVRSADGSWRSLEAASAELSDERDPGRAYYLRDITGRKILEEELAFQALHDPLTGLANRTSFITRLKCALNRSAWTRENTAVLFIDLDDFKQINDRMGHAVGDRLLVTVGRRLQSCLRDTDTVARIGGDEFTVLIEAAESLREITAITERLLEALKPPIALGQHKVRITVSVGIATSDSGMRRAEDLLRAADTAMYQVKMSGKAGYEVFGETLPHPGRNPAPESSWQPRLSTGS
jgi:diguanylate cyclase (GGDEF)-like protein/PAS domain S-box-containing protein